MAKVKKVKVPPVALLTHSPSPGLYSRLERAVEQLPEVVKTEGLENRLKKFKEGVAGWEMQPVMEAVAMRDILGEHTGNPRKDITRKELLELVRESSPAFTQKEGIRTGEGTPSAPAGPLGSNTIVGPASPWKHYSEGVGDNYREHLLMNNKLPESSSGKSQWEGGHWKQDPHTYAHLRTADVGDAVRIQELQSDVRNQNIKARAQQAEFGESWPDKWDASKFPLYEAYPEVLLKSMLLGAAQRGLRAVEIPPLSHLQRNTHMRPEGVEHVYHQLAPNTLAKIVRPLGGGLAQATPFERARPDSAAINQARSLDLAAANQYSNREAAQRNILALAGLSEADGALMGPTRSPEVLRTLLLPGSLGPRDMWHLQSTLAADAADARVLRQLNSIYLSKDLYPLEAWELGPLVSGQSERLRPYSEVTSIPMVTELAKRARNDALAEIYGRMPAITRQVELMRSAQEERLRLLDELSNLPHLQAEAPKMVQAPSRRLEISDDLRRKLIQGGIGLSVLAGANAATALASNQASAAEPENLSLQPIEGQEGQFFLPNGVNANPFATPSPDEQRQIPIDNLPDAAMTNRRAMLDYDIEGERGRQSATKALIEAGVDPDVAELRATKIMEWARPTISAEAMRSISPDYEGDAPVSPDAFLRQHLTNQAIGLMMEGKPTFDPQKAYQLAVRSVMGLPGNQDAAGDENSSVVETSRDSTPEVSQQALQDTLEMIAQHAPEGEFSDKSGITEAELETLKQSHGNHANFMYPDRLRPNFQALRQHELLTAGMPGHEPSSGMSMALRAVGAPFDADTMAMHKQDMAALHGSMDPQAVTAKQAMYWWNRAKPNPNAMGYDSYRDEQTNGSKYAKFSTTTPTGLIGGLGEDASRRYGAATQYMQPLGTDPSASRTARQFLSDIRRDTKRPVPIIRPGLTPQETDEFGKIAKDYGTKSDAWLSADLAKDIGAYPTGFADTVLRSPFHATDPASLADMALTATTGGIGGIRTAKTLIGKLAKGGASMVRPVTRNVGEEALQEGLTNTALTPAFGQTVKDFVFTPQQSNVLAQDDNGDQVDPMDAKRYRETVDRNWQNARSTLQYNAEQYRRKRNNWYGTGQ